MTLLLGLNSKLAIRQSTWVGGTSASHTGGPLPQHGRLHGGRSAQSLLAIPSKRTEDEQGHMTELGDHTGSGLESDL